MGPKSRTEEPRKTKIGTEVAYVTRDSRHHFQGQKLKGQLAEGGEYCGGLPHSLLFLKYTYTDATHWLITCW